jgi:chorismate mutase/prephenate dehydrogenase
MKEESNTPIDLNTLRQGIDEIDSELVSLLAKRASLTKRVGQYKSQTGLPIYVPEREAELIEKRRQQALMVGVSPSLVEDLLRRIMRESYQTQHVIYKKQSVSVDNVVVIGGEGALGKVFVDMFRRSEYAVEIIEEDDWERAPNIFAKAGLVIVAVPIKVTESVIQQLTSLPKDCILADITSVKNKPLNAMLEAHAGPVVGLHPMFGPDVSSLVKQVVVVCHGRHQDQYQWLLEQIITWGAVLNESNAQVHDDAMAFIQVMRHFTTFVFGAHLAGENPDLEHLIKLSSPIYRLELNMVGRLFAQDPSLYAEIIFGNKDSVGLLKRFRDHFDQALILLENGNKGDFIKQFLAIGHWFGPFAKQSLLESKKLLQKADDDRQLSN